MMEFELKLNIKIFREGWEYKYLFWDTFVL